MIRYAILPVCLTLLFGTGLLAQSRIATDPEIPFGGTYFDRAYGYGFGYGGFGVRPGSVAVGLDGQTRDAGELVIREVAAADAINGRGVQVSQSFINHSLSGTAGTPGLVIAREHLPLIQVKVRVIEVDRADGLSVSSILEYVAGQDGATRTSGRTLNQVTNAGVTSGVSNTRAGSNFSIPGLITALSSGSGGIINLTSDHINWLASFLATEFNGDILTAPQVTTIHGETVVFQAGQKIPFQIGANVVAQDANTIQQFFYKHVGTYIAVTPQIVNWDQFKGAVGPSNPDRRRFLPVAPMDVLNYEAVAEFLLQRRSRVTGETIAFGAYDIKKLSDDRGLLDPEKILSALNRDLMGRFVDVTQSSSPVPYRVQIDRDFLTQHTGGLIQEAILADVGPCGFNPADCTIDLDILVRLSDAGTSQTVPADSDTGPLTIEDNVRSIANIVQVRSGNGVVMGGLISMRDEEAIDKIPIAGDLPLVGPLFRSKQNLRRKVETLIFVEATVLPSLDTVDECGGNAIEGLTSEDFCNARQHLQCDLCTTDLAQGMRAAGLANGYLPPPTAHEKKYWDCYHRSIRDVRQRKAFTQLNDVLK